MPHIRLEAKRIKSEPEGKKRLLNNENDNENENNKFEADMKEERIIIVDVEDYYNYKEQGISQKELIEKYKSYTVDELVEYLNDCESIACDMFIKVELDTEPEAVAAWTVSIDDFECIGYDTSELTKEEQQALCSNAAHHMGNDDGIAESYRLHLEYTAEEWGLPKTNS